MKKIYSLVLMAAVLLIGTNAWAVTRTVNNDGELRQAWQDSENQDVIKLTNDVTLTKTLWLGTVAMNDANPKSITLDLNGKTLYFEDKASSSKMFVISHGELNVITSLPGGKIEHQGTSTSSNFEIFRVHGSTYENINPKVSGYYSHLSIGKGVKLIAKANGVVVDQMSWTSCKSNEYPNYKNVVPTKGITIASDASSWPAALNTSVLNTAANKSTGNRGVANGVLIDIYGSIEATKYAVKANGNLGSPSNYPLTNYSGYWENPGQTVAYNVNDTDVLYSPFIHIYSSAELLTTDYNSQKSVAAYSGGYARWLIEGSCVGSTGVYVKSGQLEIKDAYVASNYSGNAVYTGAVATNSGVECGGSGIVMQSSTGYAGDIDVTVAGDTKVSATTGYAIDEAVTSKVGDVQVTKVDAITITGGTFDGGTQGTMRITEPTAEAAQQENPETVIKIIGGSSDNTSTTIGSQSLEQFLADQNQTSENKTHVTYIDNGNGVTMVISEGEAPAPEETKTSWSDIANFDDGSDANWTGKGDVDGVGVIASGSTVELGELLINAATSTEKQELTIQNNAVLIVDHITMNAHAQIIVEAGGRFIVKGEQGIVAPKASNIILKADENKQAIFLFNPAVTSNRHPNATVEFKSKSYTKSANDWAKQIFGIPTNTKLSEITTKYAGVDVATGFEYFDYADAAWKTAGYVNVAGKSLDYDKIGNPFTYYRMQHNTANVGTDVVMKGALTGNIDAQLNVLGNFWCGYANSYMAPINGETLIDLITAGTVDKAYYLYYVDAETSEWGWWEQSLLDNSNIKPMQPFLLRNPHETAGVKVDYAEAVYYNLMPKSAPAPRRAALNDITKAKLIVRGEENVDRLVVAEGDQFSSAFDNGYDVVKYMDQGIKLYVSADEKMGIFATDNLENTYVGFKAVNGGNYTIEFAGVQGNDLTLIDHETNARIAMVNGSVYEFTAAANSVNDYRFEIVSRDNAPTAIENTEAVKSAKGIYTITGQYVGEMNVWNTLPAGVYVVNGEKLVK